MTDLSKILNDPQFLNNLKGRQFLLDNYVQPKAKNKRKGPGRPSFKVPPEESQYSLYVKLNQMWVEYMDDLLSSNYSAVNIQEKLIKADFHGAILTVWKASCDSYVGHTGIVIHETKRAFRIISTDNKIRMLLKQDAVFSLEIGDKVVKLFGEHYQYRPADRIKAKWSKKDTLKLMGLS